MDNPSGSALVLINGYAAYRHILPEEWSYYHNFWNKKSKEELPLLLPTLRVETSSKKLKKQQRSKNFSSPQLDASSFGPSSMIGLDHHNSNEQGDVDYAQDDLSRLPIIGWGHPPEVVEHPDRYWDCGERREKTEPEEGEISSEEGEEVIVEMEGSVGTTMDRFGTSNSMEWLQNDFQTAIPGLSLPVPQDVPPRMLAQILNGNSSQTNSPTTYFNPYQITNFTQHSNTPSHIRFHDDAFQQQQLSAIPQCGSPSSRSPGLSGTSHICISTKRDREKGVAGLNDVSDRPIQKRKRKRKRRKKGEGNTKQAEDEGSGEINGMEEIEISPVELAPNALRKAHIQVKDVSSHDGKSRTASMKQRLTVDDMDVDSNIGNQQRDYEFAPSNTSSNAQPSQLPASTHLPHSGVSCRDQSISSSVPQSTTVSKKKPKKKKKRFIAPPVDPLTQPSYHTQ